MIAFVYATPMPWELTAMYRAILGRFWHYRALASIASRFPMRAGPFTTRFERA